MSLWTNLIDDYGYENLLFYGTFLVTTIAYWSVSFLVFWFYSVCFEMFAPFQVSLLYLSLDVYGWAPVLTKYKVQPGSKRGIEKHKLRSAKLQREIWRPETGFIPGGFSLVLPSTGLFWILYSTGSCSMPFYGEAHQISGLISCILPIKSIK